MFERLIRRVIPAINSADGAGVRLRRSVGQMPQARLDPFLMLDNFSSDNPDDYIAGFPFHPHRGFETVTYMVDGTMRHRDHLGHEMLLKPGGVQWMTAGRGIIHEEMPEQKNGLMRGFQLWINLPAAEKMKAPAYYNLEPDEVGVIHPQPGVHLHLVAGDISVADNQYSGAISGISRDPMFVDIELDANAEVVLPVKPELAGFLYLFEGAVKLSGQEVPANAAVELDSGDRVALKAGADGARLLLIAGLPVKEPVAQYGPFVMNTVDEVQQAIDDYNNERFVEPA